MDDDNKSNKKVINNQTQRHAGLAMIIVAWVLILGLLYFIFESRLSELINPNTNPVTTFSNNAIEISLQANKQHHYIVSGSINDQPVIFLLDTGATHVAIPAHLAKSLGLERGFPITVSTANGDATAFSTTVNRVKIGAIELRDLPASLNPGMKEDIVLLGMSALRQIEFTQRGNTLTLRQQQQQQ